MNRDENLLFGVFAVQLRKVTPPQIMEAAGAWATDPSRGLAQRLEEMGAISASDRELIRRLVSEAIAAHGGDAGETLAALGGKNIVADSFHRSIKLDSDGLITHADLGVNLLSLEDPIVLKGVDETPGRYTCESEHARGGMGRVLLVYDEYLGREIALKELLPDPHTGSTPTPVRSAMPVLARFLQEARVTGQLEHPSIVPVYELGHRLDGALYYTMKLVRGRTLGKAIAETRGLEERLRLLPHFVDLCQAIAYAHSRKVIHRDIKPGNVMVGEFGETVVLDWGLTKVVGKDDVHADAWASTLRAVNLDDTDLVAKTQYGEALGTPMYMPPEQAKGQLDQVDERSDVYSLGAVLYELLTGVPPFEGKSVPEILKRVIEDNPRPIIALAPPELAAIAMRALEKDPERRYQSVKELADEVQRFQAGTLVQAYEYSPREYFARYVRQHKAAFVSAGIALAAAVILVAYGYVRIARERNEAVFAWNSEARQREAADRARKVAQRVARSLERANYAASIILASNALDAFNVALARERLMQSPPDLRNWEWGYLYRELDRSALTLTGHGNWIRSAAYSPDGARIVTASRDMTAKVWDAATAKELLTLTGHGGEIFSAAYSPDSAQIVTASRDMTAKVWDAATAKELLTLTGHGDWVSSAAYSPNGARIVTASRDRTAKVWDAATAKELLTLAGHGDWVSSAVYSPDGTRIVTASRDRTAKVWDTATGTELLTLTGHGNEVFAATYSPDGTRIVTGSGDKTAKVWDAATGEELLTLTGHGNWIRSATYSPDSTRIITGSGDNTARVWDAATGRESRILIGHGDEVFAAMYSPDGARIITGSLDKTAKVWDATTGEESLTLTGQGSVINSAAYSPDGARIVTASRDNTAKVWDAATGKELLALTGHEDEVFSAAYSPDAARIVTASHDNTAKVWDAATGKELLTLIGHRDWVSSATYSPDGARIVTASRDNTAKVWDAATGEELLTLTGHGNWVRSAAYSPDGERIVTGSDDNLVKAWDAATGKELLTLIGHRDWVSSAAYSPDGERIIAGSGGDTAKVWNATTGEELLTLTGHGDEVRSAAYSPDGARIVTASRDRTAKVWNAATGEELLTLTGHESVINSAAYSPDGLRILTASSDETVREWDAAPWIP